LTADILSALKSLHCKDIGRITDVSEIHVASNFRVEVGRLCSCSFDPEDGGIMYCCNVGSAAHIDSIIIKSSLSNGVSRF
jgi:hypothetical protein